MATWPLPPAAWCGPQHAGDGQAHIAARLVRVSPEIADWATALPPGIVVLEPWLAPAGGVA